MPMHTHLHGELIFIVVKMWIWPFLVTGSEFSGVGEYLIFVVNKEEKLN